MSSIAPAVATSHALPAHLSVRDARAAYLAENGFTLEAYDEPTTRAYVLGIPFAVPNTAHHRRALMLHDLHHVATGFGTNLTGEGEISAWELRGGLRSLGWVGALVVIGALVGLLVAPRRTLRAWRLGGRARNLFGPDAAAEEHLSLTLGELRQRLGLPPEGLAHVPRGLHERAPRG
jgi:hypothetical protein